jgi:hypothetical protein
MKKHGAMLTIFTMLLTATLLADVHYANAQTEDPNKFEQYRAAIKQKYGIDIKDFKETMRGGRADGKKVTKYDLQQLLMGISVEQEHVRDKMTALEISMDHLEEFPDYYTRLKEMEDKADHDKELEDRAKKGRE